MAQRIAAIAVIFGCTGFAWLVLGSTIFARTQMQDAQLRHRVVSTWGGVHEQQPPVAWVDNFFVPIEQSRIDVRLELDQRQKGLLWYSTYRVGFQGEYLFRYDGEAAGPFQLSFPLPADKAIYDDLTLTVDGEPVEFTNANDKILAWAEIPAGGSGTVSVSYTSQGLDSWSYAFGEGVARVEDFELTAVTDFAGIDFADDSLSPTVRNRQGDGWELVWTYSNLLSGQRIQVDMPQRIQPGPLAGRISYFAPVSLLFFFFALFLITTLRKTDLHPLNYFFLAAAFFAFHLLLAYLADHISIHAAFAISAAVSLFLVVSYLRLVTGLRFAVVEAGGAQLVYLVLFSYAFFFEGFTGLTVTIGSILTLFAAMQLTGRIRWGEKSQGAPSGGTRATA